MTKFFVIAAGVCFLSLSACSSTQLDAQARPSDGTKPDVAQNYDQRIEMFSAGDTEYAGLYNNFEYKGTLLNSFIRTATLAKQSAYYQWDAEKTQVERTKQNQELASQTNVFISFFTPDRRNDNLTETKTIWRLYLEVGGRRYEGTVKKVRTLLVELQALYPYHTRWNTPYLVTFLVPTTAIESQPAKMTITGPLGTRAVDFRALN